jgi:hypothetical protein
MPTLFSPTDYMHKQYASMTALTGAAGGRDRLRTWDVGEGGSDKAWIHTLNDGFWGNWMFEVGGVNATDGTLSFHGTAVGGGREQRRELNQTSSSKQ